MTNCNFIVVCRWKLALAKSGTAHLLCKINVVVSDQYINKLNLSVAPISLTHPVH